MQIVLWNLHQQQVNSLEHYLKKNQVKIRFEMSRNHSDLACRRTMSMESDFQEVYGPKKILRCDHRTARGKRNVLRKTPRLVVLRS